ncbi:MAG TPA: flavoprotein, partial [Chitinophagaceae bacterium]|nr:flavoprotein [Chitinophagaceae bacterium]
MQKKKIVLAISGASGSVYARQLLELLTLRNDCEVALVMSRNARSIWEYELGNTHYLNYKHMTWETDNYNAPFASGSSRYEKMIIAPCSMGTLGR